MKRYVILASLTALLISGAISIRMEETPPEPQPAREEVLIPAPQGEANEYRVRALLHHMEEYFSKYSILTMGINEAQEITFDLVRFDRETIDALTEIAHAFDSGVSLRFVDAHGLEIRPTQV
ncbi:MAG: hypothetical protein HFF34_04110 [Oscillospiraceae bacterium]|jgi:hypothetical protein|nr:hypothetical protein [Oscillospiraceae bacterium]MCI9394881.1 hypothetical protein [Oscillospiraceae bacterium]MCI9580544.1 hypothetical protein [Oscillospiraceae bacterium]